MGQNAPLMAGDTPAMPPVRSNAIGSSDDSEQSPQREAAFFFGLFLRGHDAEQLRQDIDFPPKLMERWHRRHDPQAPSREELQRLFDFRKRVLAIFNFLVSTETGRTM